MHHTIGLIASIAHEATVLVCCVVGTLLEQMKTAFQKKIGMRERNGSTLTQVDQLSWCG